VPTRTPTQSPAHTLTAPPTVCGGDCDGDGRVTVDELITGVNIALGLAAVDRCPPFDTGGDGAVSVAELVAAVSTSLAGC
jgi:hypothetical protein